MSPHATCCQQLRILHHWNWKILKSVESDLLISPVNFFISLLVVSHHTLPHKHFSLLALFYLSVFVCSPSQLLNELVCKEKKSLDLHPWQFNLHPDSHNSFTQNFVSGTVNWTDAGAEVGRCSQLQLACATWELTFLPIETTPWLSCNHGLSMQHPRPPNS